VCDGKDNDCNNKIDDGITRECTTPCGKGVEVCAKGRWGACRVAAAAPETCNNKDDDCDGKVDEDLTQPVTQGQKAVSG